MDWWSWILFGLALLIVELFLPSGFFIFFFGVGALLTGTLVGFGLIEALEFQWAFCTLASIVLGLVFRKYLMGQWVSAYSISNSPEGKEVKLNDDVASGASGSCEYRGSSWNVRNTGSGEIKKGERAIVEGREGFTLLVKKLEN